MDKSESLVLKDKMKTKRSSAGLTGADTKLFAIRGWDVNGAVNHCEMFDISANSWKRLPSLKRKWAWPGVCCLKNIYCFGGRFGLKTHSIEMI